MNQQLKQLKSQNCNSRSCGVIVVFRSQTRSEVPPFATLRLSDSLSSPHLSPLEALTPTILNCFSPSHTSTTFSSWLKTPPCPRPLKRLSPRSLLTPNKRTKLPLSLLVSIAGLIIATVPIFSIARFEIGTFIFVRPPADHHFFVQRRLKSPLKPRARSRQPLTRLLRLMSMATLRKLRLRRSMEPLLLLRSPPKTAAPPPVLHQN